MRLSLRGRGMPLAVLLTMALAAGCSSDAANSTQSTAIDTGDARRGGKGPAYQGVSTVTVSLDSTSLAPTHTATARAVAMDSHGNVVTGLVTSWQSSNEAIAKVSSSGIITAVAPGSVTVRATISNVSGSAPLSVVNPPPTVATVASVIVTLDSTKLTIPNKGQARAALRDATGQVIDGTVTWASDNGAVATVSSTGVVAAVGAGSTVVRGIAANGVHGTASLTVAAPVTIATVGVVAVTLSSPSIAKGSTTQATAKVYDTNGSLVAGTTVNWTSSNGSVVSVNSSGVVTGLAAGSASIVGTVNNAYGSAPITVTSGGATQLAAAVQPAGAVSGINLTTQPVVQLRDASNAVATASTAAVTATLAGDGATLSGTTTVTAVNGVATFTNLRVNGSGSHTITFTSSGLTSATSSSFTVIQNAASLSVQTQPGNSTSGTALSTQPVVRVLDNAGLVDLSFNSPVAATLTFVSGSGSLSGTTSVTAVAGVATFTNLTVTGSGTFTLKFTTPTPALQISSNQFTASATATTIATPTQLAITTQPSSSATSGTVLAQQPSIQLRDASNQAVSKSGVVVTAAIASGGGTLGGTLTATTNASGVATFTNLSITATTGSQTLTFSAPGLTSTTSASISVTTTVTGTGFATPNLMNNASFESSWNGFTDWTTAASPTGVSRDNTLAYDGSWSIRRTWAPNPSGDVGAQLASTIGNVDRIWVRFYVRLTAPVTTVMKYMRFFTPGFNQTLGGLFLGQGNEIFLFGSEAENSEITTTIGLTEAQVIDGNWHSLEVELWRNGDPSGWPSAAFWFDGKPQYLPDGTYVKYSCYQPSPPSTCNKSYWQGGRLYSGARSLSSSLQMNVMEWIGTINQGNTTTGQINLDRIAISTVGRIGP